MSSPPTLRRRRTDIQAVGIGLLGCGTVGEGVVQLLQQNAHDLAERAGAPLELRRVLVRDRGKARGCDPALLTDDPEVVFGDAGIQLLVEVIGGEGVARELVERAIDSGRGVVTANKLLIARHGRALVARAVAADVDLAFEGAVGGGIPIVRTLREAFAGDRVTSITGILNGTSNYVLTRMLDGGLSMGEAVAEAQRAGYAEADPSMDIDGVDAAHKLAILATLGFGVSASVDALLVEGIGDIELVDHRFAARLGHRIKPLVIGRDHGDEVELRVHPALVPERSVLANVSGVLNAVLLEGDALGPSLVYGQGAGGPPTAVSVLSDILDVARSIAAGADGLQTRCIRYGSRPLREPDRFETRYYVRFTVDDRPGVMAGIAGALGGAGVSIEQLIQDSERSGGRVDAAATVVLVTHMASERALRSALDVLRLQSFLLAPPRVLRIEAV